MTPMLYRQGIMQQFQANQQALTAIRAGTVGAQANVLNRAIILQQLALSLNDAFPPNSAGEGSRALPLIWTNTADFVTKVNAIQGAATTLVEAARAGDAQQIATAQTGFNGTCGACHMMYRGPAPGN